MTSPGRDADPSADDLPPELADRAAERWLAAPHADWAALCEQLVAEHPEHAAALRALHADLVATERLLAGSAAPAAAPNAEATHFGGHRVLRRLGEGAFGVVYLCQQDHPVQRQVAVKVMRPGTGNRGTLRRFAAERQLLASLQHAAITQVFDAGELADGRPYFVMEYVPGTDIRSYCTSRALSYRERLQLFLELGHGVAHAHHRGIVHRDLKPANVLVVDTEAGPRVKIIDFGIAKAIAGDDGASGATHTGCVIGTPGYMSPEQAAGQGADVDARADVFSLGVMLYELLTGELPWSRGMRATDSEPQRPSARVATTTRRDGTTSPTTRTRLAAQLRGDLDWITVTAIARDRDERYASVADLLADIERHLRGETVSVGPPSLSYRLRKFVRRHRAAVLALGAGLALAGATWFVTSRQRAGVAAELEQAERRAEDRSRDATAAVERLLARASDERLRQLPANDEVRRAIGAEALAFYDSWLAERPQDTGLRTGRCRALVTLSSVHWQLGQMPAAVATAAEAVTEAEALFAAAPADLATRTLLADALRRSGRALALSRRGDEARPRLAAAVAHLEHAFGVAPRDHGLSLAAALRELLSTEPDEPARLQAARRAVAVLETLDGSEHAVARDLLISRSVLAQQLAQGHQPEAADEVMAAALAALDTMTADRAWAAAMVHTTRTRILRQRGDSRGAAAAIDLAVQACETWRREEPRRVAPATTLRQSLEQAIEIHDRLRQWPRADARIEQLTQLTAALAAEFPDDLQHLANHYEALRDAALMQWNRFRQADLPSAAALADRALQVHTEWERKEPQRQTQRWEPLHVVGFVLDARGEASAELWDRVRTALQAVPETDPPANGEPFAAWLGVARSALRRDRLDDAERALAQAGRFVALLTPRHASELAHVQAQLALRRGDAAGAVAATDRMLAGHSSWLGAGRAGDHLMAAAALLAGRDEPDTELAADYRERAVASFRQVLDSVRDDVAAEPDDPWHVVPWGFAGLQLAQLEAAAGRPDEARTLLGAALPALARVADVAHRDQWRGDVLEHGKALQQSLAPKPGR